MADNTPPDLATRESNSSSDSLATITPTQRPRSIHSTHENTLAIDGDQHDRGRAVQGQGSYGSFASFNTAQSEQAAEEPVGDGSSMQERSQGVKTASSASSLRRQKRSGERPVKPPIVSRRTSVFHKKQEFSTDDDPAEVEADLAQQQQQQSVLSSTTGRGTLRKQPSTLRRRGVAPPPLLERVDSRPEENIYNVQEVLTVSPAPEEDVTSGDEEGAPTVRADSGPEDANEDHEDDDDDDDELSDAESFTLKDRQDAINETHPFGIRVWKPALYKKNRSVEKSAEGDIHSSPGGQVSNWLFIFNILWTLFFGWWLACSAALGGAVCLLLGWTSGGIEYGRVLIGLSTYLFYPFGKFVRLHQDEAYAEEDEGEGRSISEYEQWQSGDLEDGRLFFGPRAHRSLIGRRRNSMDSASEGDSLLGRTWRRGSDEDGLRNKRRLFGRGEWNLGRVLFFFIFYGLIAPLLLLASGICWLLVFWIPMGKVTMLLYSHLRRHPLALSFHSAGLYSRGPGSPSSSILLCTYRAVGLKYWKYTIDGTNIFLINLMSVVLFTIVDYWILDVTLHLKFVLTSPAVIFLLALFSIIPLAYFIGQAVASISAQSSMGVGAAINAFFSTIVEVYLYCIALNEGKGKLVEGSIIGSIFAGVLFLPGVSMCFGALKRKTQRFNAKSAGVTSTMLLFAVIAAFSPTLFYQIYGTHELNCQSCVDTDEHITSRDCRRCYFSQVPAINDRFFDEAVRPYCFFAAALLFLSYAIGLWFTLRTHAAVIWNMESEEKKTMHNDMQYSATEHGESGVANGSLRHPHHHGGDGAGGDGIGRPSVRDSQMYKKILGQSLRQTGLGSGSGKREGLHRTDTTGSAHIVPSEPTVATGSTLMNIPGLSEQENRNLVHEVVQVAATAATIAARDVGATPVRVTSGTHHGSKHSHGRSTTPGGAAGGVGPANEENDDAATIEALAPTNGGGGHDAPNWSRMKSTVILLGATLLYAIIAEILVNTVDVVLDNAEIDEKFLGITLFALVPNTTEFLNAISFAMNGNIALSMEIGSAYALQVCLLQIPALVLYSGMRSNFFFTPSSDDLLNHTFTLIFPQWDMITVTLCVFLLSYMYGEGKSNYFKGSILLLSYLVVIMGFFMSGKAGLASGGVVGGGVAGGGGIGMGWGRFDPPIRSSSSSTTAAAALEVGKKMAVETVRTVGRSGKGMMMGVGNGGGGPPA